jgi:hypothetical protein
MRKVKANEQQQQQQQQRCVGEGIPLSLKPIGHKLYTSENISRTICIMQKANILYTIKRSSTPNHTL